LKKEFVKDYKKDYKREMQEQKKDYKRETQEQKNKELLNKKAEAFLERFKQMSPAEQEKCLQKLNYEMGLIEAKIKDARANTPTYRNIELTNKQKLILEIASAVVVGSSLGVLGTLSKAPEMSIAVGLNGAAAGACFGILGADIIEKTSLLAFFSDLKAKRLNKKIIKHQAKQLKLAKRLELIKSAQPQENEFMLN
jgi:ATPase subunit of ABC transporter with duplicated ATPase domains